MADTDPLCLFIGGHQHMKRIRVPRGMECVEAAVIQKRPLDSDLLGTEVDTKVTTEVYRVMVVSMGGLRYGYSMVVYAPAAWTAEMAISEMESMRIILASTAARWWLHPCRCSCHKELRGLWAGQLYMDLWKVLEDLCSPSMVESMDPASGVPMSSLLSAFEAERQGPCGGECVPFVLPQATMTINVLDLTVMVSEHGGPETDVDLVDGDGRPYP